MWSLYSLQSDDFEMLVDSDVSSDNEVDSDSSESDSDGPSEIKKSRAGRRQGSWKSKKWFGDWKMEIIVYVAWKYNVQSVSLIKWKYYNKHL